MTDHSHAGVMSLSKQSCRVEPVFSRQPLLSNRLIDQNETPRPCEAPQCLPVGTNSRGGDIVMLKLNEPSRHVSRGRPPGLTADKRGQATKRIPRCPFAALGAFGSVPFAGPIRAGNDDESFIVFPDETNFGSAGVGRFGR